MKAYVMDHLPEIIGFLATLCTISSFLPQAIKIMRERDAEGVSLRMYAITVTGFSLWTAYGVLMESLPLIVANAASLSLYILLDSYPETSLFTRRFLTTALPAVETPVKIE